MPRALAALSALAGVLLLAIPITAIAQDLDEARDRVDGLKTELADATERYEQTWAAVEAAAEELQRLEDEAERLEDAAEELERQLADRARQVFMRGSTATLELLFAAEGPDQAVEVESLVAAIQDRDTVDLEAAVAARTSLDRTRLLVEERRAELEGLEAELTQLQEHLEARLSDAEVEVVALEKIAARQRRIDRGDQRGTYACPLDRGSTHFVDSWGAPRSGGRSHKGTDVMGPMGAPVYAITSGVIARHSNSRLGGISLYLRGDDGSTYFYTHLQGYAPLGSVGTRVQAGDHVAVNGHTGNPRGGPAHIHFERHPGGGGAVNPYPYLAAACF